MKKTAAILIAMLMTCTFVACAGDGGDTSDVSDVQSETVSTVESSEPAESSAEESSEPAALDYVENIADYTVETDENGELMITKYNGSDPYIIIPAEYDGKPITAVYCTTLAGCDFIKGVKVSEGIIQVDKDEYIAESDKNVFSGFCGCTSYEELTLPSTLKILGNLAHSENLKEIVIPDGIILDDYQFFGCSALERVVLPKYLTSIGIQAFVGCDSLKEITLPPKLTGIARGAFSGVPIKELRLPDTMEHCVTGSLPSGAKVYISKALSEKVCDFGGSFLDMLKDEFPNIEIIILDYVENIADYTVETDENGELMITKYNGSDPYIIIPAEYDGKPITAVYCTALLDCDFIKGIRVSEGIIEVDRDEYTLESEQIVEYGFCGCTSYEELTLPSTLKSLGTLMHSKNLRELVIPDGVTALELYAIAGCDALEKVVMSKNITSIPIDCFVSCGNLREIVLPEKLTGISKAAFAGTAITEFHLPDTMELVYGSPFPTGVKVYISKALSEKEGFLDMLKDECPNIEIIIE